MWGLELTAKKEFLKMSLVQKGDFIEAQGTRPMGRKSCPGTTMRDWFYTVELGEVKSRGSFQGDFHMLKEDSRILEA